MYWSNKKSKNKILPSRSKNCLTEALKLLGETMRNLEKHDNIFGSTLKIWIFGFFDTQKHLIVDS